jgi:excisionase family DNA binding protein
MIHRDRTGRIFTCAPDTGTGSGQPEPITVTVPEARRISGLGNTTIYELIRTGKLKSTTVGTRRLIDFASLRDLLTAKAATVGGQ